MARKQFAGGAVPTTLSSGISNSATTIAVADGATYPDGSVGPFVIKIDGGTSSEEKVLATARSGNSLTGATRGYDGTVGVSHSSGATVEHVLDALTVDEANAHVNDDARDDHSQYLNTTRHNDAVLHTIGGELPAATVFADAILPPGIIAPYAGSAAPTGWLLCNGATVSQATYAALFAVTGHTYGADPGGGNFILPSLKGKVPVGIDAAQTEFDVRGETGGAKTVALVTGEMPAHTHATGTHAHSGTSGNQNANHNHTMSGSTTTNGSHQHNADGGVAGTTLTETGFYTQPTGNQSANHGHSIPTEGAMTTDSKGSGTAHANLQPYIALHYIVKT